MSFDSFVKIMKFYEVVRYIKFSLIGDSYEHFLDNIILEKVKFYFVY